MRSELSYYKQKIIEFFCDLITLFSVDKLFISAHIERENNKYIKTNWGDDLNLYLLEIISHKKIVIKNKSWLFCHLPLNSYSCIGSILGFYNDKRIIVWGSGFISSTKTINYPPQKIISVRGKLTKQRLEKLGIECPTKYGDPALLISRFYRPKVQKKYEIGIVLHISDENNRIIKELASRQKNLLIIRMSEYDRWQDIPDKICSCKRIISSSLHGLIAADSYSIPNLWVKFSNNITGDYFKFLDYFSSVNRHINSPIVIESEADFQTLLKKSDFSSANKINFDEILQCCPFYKSSQKSKDCQ